jgi:hypothetical protein
MNDQTAPEVQTLDGFMTSPEFLGAIIALVLMIAVFFHALHWRGLPTALFAAALVFFLSAFAAAAYFLLWLGVRAGERRAGDEETAPRGALGPPSDSSIVRQPPRRSWSDRLLDRLYGAPVDTGQEPTGGRH